MKNYFEAEEVKKIIDKLLDEPEYQHNGETFYSGVSAVDVELLTLTPANVIKVPYGKWLNTGSYDAHHQPIYICSVCGKEVADTYIKYHKYCLHCGAKMIEERI